MPYIGNTPALDYISYAVQNFTVTAATTVYTLDYSVSNENDIALYINSVAQRPGVSFAYSATGTTLTLTSATLATDTMYAVFIGRAVQTVTPPASSVTNTMLTPSVITGQTAETSVAGGDLVLIYDDSASSLRKMTVANFGNTPAFSVYLTSDQVLSNATVTKITLDAESFDTDNAFASNKFTVPAGKAGKYLFIGTVTFINLTDNDEGQVRIHKNGSLVQGSAYFTGQNGTVTYQVSTVENLAVSDYIELFAYQVSGGNISADGGVEYTNFKGFRLIGA